MFYNLSLKVSNYNRYAFSFHVWLVLMPKKREQNKEKEKMEKTEPDDEKKEKMIITMIEWDRRGVIGTIYVLNRGVLVVKLHNHIK